MADKKLEYWENELEKAFDDLEEDADLGPALGTFYRWMVAERKVTRPPEHTEAVHRYTYQVVTVLENACRRLRELDKPSGEPLPLNPD